MKNLRLLPLLGLLSVIIALLLAELLPRAYGGWGKSCGPVGSAAPAPVYSGPIPCDAAANFTGWRMSDSTRCWYYWDRGRQVAGWDPREKVYRTYDATRDQWSEPQPPPWKVRTCVCTDDCPCADECACSESGAPCCRSCPCVSTVAGVTNYGLDLSKLGSKERYTVNGSEVHKGEAFGLIGGGGQLADDSAKLRLTIIGPDAERAKVRQDLETAPALAEFRDKLLVQDYPPEHWAVRCGFKTDGHPTIYCQAPDGKVLHRQDSYTTAEDLAGALRKADPNYQPSKDPDKSKPDPKPALPVPTLPEIDLGDVAQYLPWALIGVLAVILWRKR
jgi:hypothetical protein